jgi:isoleucyl-tRNA synthetase
VSQDDAENVEKMELTRQMVSSILDERIKAGIKVRQPLTSVTFFTEKFDSIKFDQEYLQEILSETNLRGINFEVSTGVDSGKVCTLDTNITEELKIEGVYRELVRMIQDKRKEAGLKVSDLVEVILPESLDDFEKKVVSEKKAELQKECGLKSISYGPLFKVV